MDSHGCALHGHGAEGEEEAYPWSFVLCAVSLISARPSRALSPLKPNLTPAHALQYRPHGGRDGDLRPMLLGRHRASQEPRRISPQ